MENTLQPLKIESLIHEIRGYKVMLDRDLAKLYGVETKVLNQTVKRNIKRFPEDFMFQLTNEECLRSQFVTLKTKQGHHLKYMPYVFTEQGVAMLATIIKSSVATQTSIRIMDAFVSMRHYINDNEYRLSNVETKVLEHDNSIKLLQETFNKFEEKKKIADSADSAEGKE